MATAIKLKRDINKLKAAIRSKATPQSYVPKLKAQLQKAEADYESVKAGKKSAPKASKQVKSTLDKLKAIIKKKKYGAYRAQGVDLKKDADRPALRSGKRTSKSGNTYYEYRANRIDVKQPPKRYPKLEDGGMMAGGGRVMPFLKFEYATEARKKLDKGQLPVFDGGIGFDYLEKEKKLYYLPSVTGDWQEVGEFRSKKESIDWLSEQLKMQGFAKGGYMDGGGKTEGKQYAIEIKLEDGEEMAERRKRRNADTRTERVEVYSTPEEAKEAYIKYKNKGEYEGIKIKRIEYVGVYDEDNFKDGGYMAKGGEIYKIQQKFKYDLQPKWEDEKFQTGGHYYLSFKEAQDVKKKLQGLSSSMEYKVVKVEEKMAGGGYMEKGGTIDNSGMTPADLQKQIWNLTSRIAKLGDIESRAASDEIEMLMKQRKKLQSMALNHGDVVMAQGGELHRSQEEKFKYGGYMAGGNTDKTQEIFFFVKPRLVSELTEKANNEKVELEFIETNEDGNEVYRAELTDSQINDFTKLPLQYDFNYDYAKGGYMAEGGKTDEEVKKYAEHYIKEFGSVEEANKEISKTIRDLSDDDAMSNVNQLQFLIQILLYLRYEYKTNRK